MAKLRLFANLREIAGESRVEIDSDTVGGVIDAANERFGPEFARGVESARVWINGETATPDTTVSASDELVLIPPVSGGSQPAQAFAPADLVGLAPLALAVVAVLANLQGQAIWGAFLVLSAAVWAVDIAGSFQRRGRDFASLPVSVTAAGAVLAAHTLGSSGYGLTVAIAALAALGWAVGFPHYREVDSFTPMFLASLLAGLGSASLILARSAFAPDSRALDVFLVAVIVGVLLGSLAMRLQQLPLLDPFSMTALGSVVATIVSAAIWDLDVVDYLLVGLGIAIAMIAGRGLSSMLRMGRVSLTEYTPGVVVSLDGVVLAAAFYYPLIRIVL